MMMERSASFSGDGLETDEQKNGSIFKRVYNSLHRPKKGTDPMVDAMVRFEQERTREQRKKDRQEGKYKHTTISGDSLGDLPLKAASWVEDSSGTSEFGDSKAVTRLRSNSAIAQTTPNASISSTSPNSTPAHSIPSNTVSANGKRLYQSSDPQMVTEENANGFKLRAETKTMPPKPNIPSFKEFRPEKKEKIDMDKLRLSYDQPTDKLKKDDKQAEKRSSSPSTVLNNSQSVDKPISVVSSRLPSTLLPALYILNEEKSNLKINKQTWKPNKPTPQRPKHPYIPKKMDSSSSLFSMPLRSGSATKHSPRGRRESPPAPSPTPTMPEIGSTRIKTSSILHRSHKERPIKMNESFESPQPILVTPTELSRSHTEVISNNYNPTTLRRQRSHHISTSPPKGLVGPTPTTNVPSDSSPNSNSNNESKAKSKHNSESKSAFEGFSIRRKRNNKNTTSSGTRSSKDDSKKMQTQVVTAKDLVAYDAKLPVDKIFESIPPVVVTTDSPAPAQNTPSSTNTNSTSSLSLSTSMSSSHKRTLSSNSSPTSKPKPIPNQAVVASLKISTGVDSPHPSPSLSRSTSVSTVSSPYSKVPPTNPKASLKIPYSYPKPTSEESSLKSIFEPPPNVTSSPKPALLKITPNPNPDDMSEKGSPTTRPKLESASPRGIPRLAINFSSGKGNSNPSSPRSDYDDSYSDSTDTD